MCPLYVACVSTGLSLSRQKRPSRMQKKSNVRQKKALKRYLLQKDTTDVSFVLSSSASHYFTTVQKILTTNVRQKKTLQKIVTFYTTERRRSSRRPSYFFCIFFYTTERRQSSRRPFSSPRTSAGHRHTHKVPRQWARICFTLEIIFYVPPTYRRTHDVSLKCVLLHKSRFVHTQVPV
jgi:hypothetical protein